MKDAGEEGCRRGGCRRGRIQERNDVGDEGFCFFRLKREAKRAFSLTCEKVII